MKALSTTLLAVGLVVATSARADVPLTGAPSTFGPDHLSVVVAGVGLATQPATLSVTLPAGASVVAAHLYVTGRGAGDGSILLNGMTTSVPLVATSGPLPFDAAQSVETRRTDVTLGAGSNTFIIDGYDQHRPGGAFVVAVVRDPAAPLRTVALLEGADYAYRGFPAPFGPNTETAAFTFAAADDSRIARLVLFTHDTRGDRGDATWLLSDASPRPTRLVDGDAQRVQSNRLGRPAGSGGLSRGAELDVDDREFVVPAGADFLAFQIESAQAQTAPESLALSVAVLALPAAGGDGGGSTTTTTPGGGASTTTSTTPGGGGGSTTTSTTPGGGGASTTTSTTPGGGGGSTTSTTPGGGGASTSTTTPGGGGGSTSTTSPGSSATTSTTLPGGVPVPPNCGDGVLDLDEECDDGNSLSGDGCDATCSAEDTSETWKINLRVRHESIERLVYVTLLPDLPSNLLGTAPVHITLSSREFQMLDAEMPAAAFRTKAKPTLAQPDARIAKGKGEFGIWKIKLKLTPVTGIQAYDARLVVEGEMLPSVFGHLYLTAVIRVGNVVYTATDPIRANTTGKFLRYIHPVFDE